MSLDLGHQDRPVLREARNVPTPVKHAAVHNSWGTNNTWSNMLIIVALVNRRGMPLPLLCPLLRGCIITGASQVNPVIWRSG